MSIELVSERRKMSSLAPFKSPGFKLVQDGTEIGWVAGRDLRTVAGRPTCEEMKCSGCLEGQATEAARKILEAQGE